MEILRASFAAALAVAMTSSAFGRVGETKDQCAVRYGDVKSTRAPLLAKSDDEADVFDFAGFQVVVEYRGGEAWAVYYTSRKMNETNADKILANYSESSGAKWEGPTDFAGSTHWTDSKGQRHATLYASPQYTLAVFSKAAVSADGRPVVFISEVVEEPAEEPEEGSAGEEPEEKKPEEEKDPFAGF